MDNTNKNTLNITSGAMILAIFALLLIVNRQTGSFFEEFFVYLLPIPMVIYAARFNWKNGLMVFAGMVLFSFIFGTPITIFYASTAALLGLIFGTFIYQKRDMTRTLFVVMGLSAVFNTVSTVALASVFGYNITDELTMMKETLAKTLEGTGSEAILEFYTMDFLFQIFIISMVIMGLIQGFIIFKLSVLILKRLRIPVRDATPIAEYYPPLWISGIAFIGYFYGTFTLGRNFSSELIKNIVQSIWVCSFIYLVAFGVIALSLVLKKYVTRNKLVVFLLCGLAYIMFSQFLAMLGVVYIFTSFHDRLLEPREQGR